MSFNLETCNKVIFIDLSNR